jgi:predicted lipase
MVLQAALHLIHLGSSPHSGFSKQIAVETLHYPRLFDGTSMSKSIHRFNDDCVQNVLQDIKVIKMRIEIPNSFNISFLLFSS